MQFFFHTATRSLFITWPFELVERVRAATLGAAAAAASLRLREKSVESWRSSRSPDTKRGGP
jgi:hypothetical protein